MMSGLPERSLAQAQSWRLATALVRRNPDLNVNEWHPHGGLHDALRVWSHDGAEFTLNRVGTIQVIGRADRVEPQAPLRPWVEYMLAPDVTRFLEVLEADAGLPKATIRPLTRRYLVFSAIAQLAALGTVGDPFVISPGVHDSSGGFGSYEASWFEHLALIAGEVAQPTEDDPHGHAAYRFWRVERADFELTLEASTARAWPRSYIEGCKALTELDRVEPPADKAEFDRRARAWRRWSRGVDLASKAHMKEYLIDSDAFDPMLLPYGARWGSLDVDAAAKVVSLMQPSLALLDAVLSLGALPA